MKEESECPTRGRVKNFIKAEQFPYHSALGWEYDSGDYHTAMKKAHLSVAQNVALPLLLQRQPDDARVQALLTAVGLGGLGDRLPQTLSGGQLQRVAIARALVHRPKLILADEPTGNLDPSTAERVLDLLVAQVRLEAAACVLVTHSRAAAARADRVLTLTTDGMQQTRLTQVIHGIQSAAA